MNAKVQDMTGQRFGKYVVLARCEGTRPPRWRCCCDCGTERDVLGWNLKSGQSKSCGCGRPPPPPGKVRHGAAAGGKCTPEYSSWASMHSRCRNPKLKGYANYGGRGISVCERWSRFENFLEDMGARPSLAHTLDRRDNDGNYEPANCRWATKKEQAANRRASLSITYQGSTGNLVEQCDRFGVRYAAAYYRLQGGATVDQAMAATGPKGKGGRRARS